MCHRIAKFDVALLQIIRPNLTWKLIGRCSLLQEKALENGKFVIIQEETIIVGESLIREVFGRPFGVA